MRYCEECRKSIPDNATECPYCGFMFGDDKKNDINNTSFIKRININPVYIFLLIFAFFIVFGIFKAPTMGLDKNERIAYDDVKSLKESKSNPDKLKIDAIYVMLNTDGYGRIKHTYTSIEYSYSKKKKLQDEHEVIMYEDGEELEFSKLSREDTSFVELYDYFDSYGLFADGWGTGPKGFNPIERSGEGRFEVIEIDTDLIAERAKLKN